MIPITEESPIKYDAKLPSSCDIVIIGAGIIGIATAWYLADQGYRVLVCEKGRVAGEQSSRNWGWIRQAGRDEAELPIMMESIRLWQDLADRTGNAIGFRREGSLYLCGHEADISRHDKFRSFAPGYGLESNIIGADALYGLLDQVPRHWVAALHTPGDGRAEPALAVPALAEVCVQQGVAVVENCAVRGLSVANRQIDGVYTEKGFIKCSTAVCCGGAWSSSFLKHCGIGLPQLAVKASVVSTATAPLIYAGNASDQHLAFRRREDGGYTLAMTDYLEVFPDWHSLRQTGTFWPLMQTARKKLKVRLNGSSQERFHPHRDWADSDISPFENNRILNPLPGARAIQRFRSVLRARLPLLQDIAFTHSWAGMIDATPDAVPVIDAIPGIDGFFVGSGFSGHGFGLGPAAGKILANLVQNNAVEYDLSRFRLSRFSDGSRLELGPSI